MAKLIHPKLSYQVRGVLLDVYNALGPALKEEYYRNATALGLEARQVACQVEKAFEVYYEGERVGLYYVDLWIDGGKILLELKVAPTIEPIHKAQAISYLKVTDADLAIVVNFGGSSLEDERLPNFLREQKPEFSWEPQPVGPDLLYPELTNAILRACHRVHFVLGTGFFHQVYRRATMIELLRSGLAYDYLKRLPVEYQGHMLGHQEVRLIRVEDKILLATVALRQVDDGMIGRLVAYMRRLNLQLGLLANFHGTKLAVTPIRRS
jgi:GxxExxY protein